MPCAITSSSSMMRTFAMRSTILRLLRPRHASERVEPIPPPSPSAEADPGAEAAAGGKHETFEELRVGFTAAVSHELRTPLARVLALLDTALLPGSDHRGLVEQAREEVEQMGELIDEVLFLSELERGGEVVGLGTTRALPILREVAGALEEQAARAGVTLEVEGDEEATLPLRPRMIRIVAENLAENAVRYAGLGARAVLSVRAEDGTVTLAVADDGVGVSEEEVA